MCIRDRCEILEFGLENGATVETLPEQMNKALPAGIEILSCYEGGLAFKKLAFVRYEISLEFDAPVADQAEQAFRELMARESFVVKKRSKKAKSGFTEVDIIPLVEAVEEIHAEDTWLRLTLLLKAQNPGLNPDVLLQGFRSEYPELPLLYTACHRREILDDDKNVYR